MEKKKDTKLLMINMVSSGVFQLLMLIVPIITTPYVSRIFSPEQLGLYASSYSMASIFVTIAMFGIPIYGARKIAQSNDKETRTKNFFSIWFLQIFFSVICFALFNFIVITFGLDNMYYFQSFLILVTIFDISWFFIGIEEIRKNILRNFITKLVATLSIFFFIKKSNQLDIYLFINVLAMLLGNLTMFTSLRPHLILKKKYYHFSKDFRIVKESFRLLIPMLIDTTKNASSKLILVSLAGNYQAGIFDQGSKIIVLLLGILTSMSSALVPRMSHFVSLNRKNELNKYFKVFNSIISIFSVIVISGIISVGEFFVPLFFGEGYSEVVPVLIIGSFVILFGTLNGFMMNGLIIPLSLDSELIKASSLSMFSVVLLNLVFNRYLGAIGAMLSYLSSTIFLTIIYCIFLKKIINLKAFFIKIITTVILIIINYFIMFVIKNSLMMTGNIFNFILFGGISVFISVILIFIVSLKSSIFFDSSAVCIIKRDK
ncbi:oligosaccharide flippase family protein [Enterococcus faecium]